jgi:tetratricopeptide (TPR) repeat protein
MNATVAWSCQLMNAVERRAFRRLGAVPGRFSIEAAAAVLAGRDGTIQRDEALTAAATLIDKSLLQRADSTGSRPLYQMFQTVRACASLELATAGERDDTMEGLARHCTNEVSLAAEGLAGSAQSEWLDRIREELEIYRAVLAWLIERGRRADACDIGWGLGLFLLIRGHTTEGLHWYGQMLTGAALLPPVAEAKALVGAGLMHWAKGAFDQARSARRRATVLATNAAADDMVIHAESVLGHVESAAGNLDGARELYSRAVAGYRTLGLPWGVGTALNGMAGLALAAGDTDDAQRLLDEASHALRESGPWFLTPVLCFRAVLAIQRGEPDVTIALIQQSLTHIRSLQDKFAFVYALVPLALAAVLKGDPVWAARLLGARDAVAESTGAGIVDNAVQPLREHAEQQARAHLGPDGWARAYTAGRSASIDSLLKDIETARA